MRRRYFLAAGFAWIAALAPARAEDVKELNFGVISTESSTKRFSHDFFGEDGACRPQRCAPP